MKDFKIKKMNAKKVLTYGAISLVGIGGFYGKYIGRWLVYKLDPPTMINEGKHFVDAYIAKCDTLHLTMTNRVDTSSYFKARAGFNPNSDLSTEYIDQFESVFYDQRQKKHFKIIYFFPVNSLFSSMYGYHLNALHENEKNNKIIAEVNQDELKNSYYGTQKNPIPILSYAVPNLGDRFYNSINGEKGDTRFFYGTAEQFEAYQLKYNAEYYLSYVKSKVEFENMMGKMTE